MIKVESYIYNPIISPNPKNDWENKATFNGSVAEFNHKYVMAYRAIGHDSNISTIGVASSSDLYVFSNRKQIIKPEFSWEKFGCEDPRVCRYGDDYYIFYTAVSESSPGPNSIKIAVAITRDFITFEKHLVTPFNAKAMGLFPKLINGKMAAILTVNTDLPPSKISIAYFDQVSDMWSPKYWEKWYQEIDLHQLLLRRVVSDQIEIGAVPVQTDQGWLLIYSHIQNFFNGSYGTFGIEASLLDFNNPQQIIGRTIEPIMVPQEIYEMEGVLYSIIFPSGAIIKNEKLLIYYGAADNYCALASLSLSDLLANLKNNGNPIPKLKRYNGNPIIAPQENIGWKSKATFNPAAIMIDNEIHIVYRAMSNQNTSVFGYAKTTDGYHIAYDNPNPIYIPTQSFEINTIPNGFGGCEDPRLTQIGDIIYLCYTAYDGQNPPKIALTSISVSDFVHQIWDFKKPVVISDPTLDNKDGCIFPELIDGKYVFLHREGGKGIMIDYVDNLEFANNTHLERDAFFLLGQNVWEHEKTGISAPPIKTEKGWLLLYHGVSQQNQIYSVGAMLLKLSDPKIVIGTTTYPILEPEMNYEKFGQVANVVFPCGAIIKNDDIYVYYGAADTVVSVATGSISQIIESLIKK